MNNKEMKDMTQMNQNSQDSNTFDAQYTERPANPAGKGMKPKRPGKTKGPKKPHPVLTVVMCAVIAAACGTGGAWFAVTHAGTSSSGITYSSEKGTSSTTTVSNDSDGTDMTISEVSAKAQPSVVEIVTQVTSTSYGMFGGTYTSEAAGSGVIISDDGYIITNNHVIEDATTIQVTTYDGKEYDATLVATDSKSDIAVLKISATGLTAATIGDSSKIAVGDTAIVIGNPLGTLGGTVTDGIISATSRELVVNNESMELIQTNAAINAGNSGGGLFDGNGNLIGIVNAKDSGTTSSGSTIEGLGFAIPINTAMDVANELISNGKVTDRATLGVYLQEISEDTQQYTAGLYITDVISGSGAQSAGLQAYDKITKADGTDISSYSDLSKVLRDKAVGDTITLTIERSGKSMDVKVTLTGDLNTDSSTGSTDSETTLG
jgi:serine protease Do